MEIDNDSGIIFDINWDRVQEMINSHSRLNPNIDRNVRRYIESKFKQIERVFERNRNLPRTTSLVRILVNNIFLFATQPSEYPPERTADTIVGQYYATFENDRNYAADMPYLHAIENDLKSVIKSILEGKQPLGSRREISSLRDVEYSESKRYAMGGRKTRRRRRKRKARKRKTKRVVESKF